MHVRKWGELRVALLPWEQQGEGEELVCALPSSSLAMGCCLSPVPSLGFRSSGSWQLTVSHSHTAFRAEDQSRELIQLQNLNSLSCFNGHCGPRNGWLSWEGWKWQQELASLPGLLWTLDIWTLVLVLFRFWRKRVENPVISKWIKYLTPLTAGGSLSLCKLNVFQLLDKSVPQKRGCRRD